MTIKYHHMPIRTTKIKKNTVIIVSAIVITEVVVKRNLSKNTTGENL